MQGYGHGVPQRDGSRHVHSHFYYFKCGTFCTIKYSFTHREQEQAHQDAGCQSSLGRLMLLMDIIVPHITHWRAPCKLSCFRPRVPSSSLWSFLPSTHLFAIMVFTAAQLTVFFMTADYLGLSAQTAAAITAEGITEPANLPGFDKEGLSMWYLDQPFNCSISKDLWWSRCLSCLGFPACRPWHLG